MVAGSLRRAVGKRETSALWVANELLATTFLD